jgi:predicted naringenin-chalcone synthase
MRYIHQIYPAYAGTRFSNQELLSVFEPYLQRLPMDEEERTRLYDFVRFQLVGERSRHAIADWTALHSFEDRAAAFDGGADQLLTLLAAQAAPAAEAAGVTFDAVLATTATGNLMPGLSYRMAHRLGRRVRPDSMLLDLSNVGCTGSSKALNLARSLDPSFRNILVVAVEVPSTLGSMTGTSIASWQGNCTFGDGAAAAWISSDPEQGGKALALEEISYRQRSDTGLDLIRWSYQGYYGFALADEKTFERDVKQFVVDALAETEAGWKEEPRWAIHPAGIALLVRLSRKLGIPSDAIRPSVAHYRENSNMSSASLLQILGAVAEETPLGAAVNLLTMGAGFNVIYGRVRRVR